MLCTALLSCDLYMCCLTLFHVLSGPTEPPHPTSPITQSLHPPIHKGTSTPCVPPSTVPHRSARQVIAAEMINLSNCLNTKKQKETKDKNSRIIQPLSTQLGSDEILQWHL